MSILVHEISSSGIFFALENILHVVFRLSAIWTNYCTFRKIPTA